MSDTSTAPTDIFRAAIPRLHSAHDFPTWKRLVTQHLQQHGLWGVISGATPRPPGAATRAQQSWDSASRTGAVFLRQHVDDDIFGTFAASEPESESAPRMWNALVRRYDECAAGALVRAVQVLSALRYDDLSALSVPEYLDLFERAWEGLQSHTADAEPVALGGANSLQMAMRVVAGSEDAKIEFLIGSLPESLGGLARQMKQHRGERVAFVDVRDFLIRVNARREEEVARAVEERRRRVCSWCRARGLESAGHGSGECERLREFKLGGGRRGRKQKRRTQGV